MVARGDFKESRPDAQVLDRERTGASRPYGTNPYTGLDDPNGQPFLFRGDIDVRAKAMQRVVPIETATEAVAWFLDALADGEAAVTVGEIDESPLVILWKAGQSSALGESDIAAGRDVGTVGVFSSILNGQDLTFRAEENVFIDQETGTTWNVLATPLRAPSPAAPLSRSPSCAPSGSLGQRSVPTPPSSRADRTGRFIVAGSYHRSLPLSRGDDTLWVLTRGWTCR
jgi:hypothetical protein